MTGNVVLLWGVLAVINIIAFVLVGFDKKKSLNRAERFPEVLFFILSVFFASLGVLLGMFVFRHKTRKLYFLVGISALLIQQILLILLAFQKFSVNSI